MTKRSLKGTKVSTLAGLLRSYVGGFWDEDATPDSAKDNPVNLSLFKDLIDDVLYRFTSSLFGTSATDFVAFADTTDLTNAGPAYTVNNEFYAIKNGVIYKVNTGSDTEVATMTLELSSTEDGMYKTLDLADGASGSGVVDVSDILWLEDLVTFDISNSVVNVNSLTLGTGTDELDTYDEGTWTPTAADASTAGNASTAGTGNYTRIGNRCYFDLVLANIDTTGLTAGNSFYIQGLPFTPANTNQVMPVIFDSITVTGYQVTGRISANSAIHFKEQNSGSVDGEILVSDLSSTNADIWISGQYRI